MKVLVITARGLHLGYIGAYGNDWIDTPALDRLAAEGVVFDQHIADCPEPAGARRAWRSGLHHLPLAEESVSAPLPGHDLVRLLKNRGVVTALVLDESRPAPTEFSADWDVVIEAGPDDEGTALDYALEGTAQALESLAESDHWLLWIDLATLLPPWEVPDEFLDRCFGEPAVEDNEEADEDDEEDEEEREEEVEEEPLEPLLDPSLGTVDPRDEETFLRLQRSYAAAVAYVDAGVELLLKELEGRQLLDDVLVIFTTDHGFPLAEHGLVGLHRPWLHDELVHLPLLMRLPKAAEAGRRVDVLTQPADLMPTLLEAFGVEPPTVHGHSLLPLARGAGDELRPYACSGLSIGRALEWSLRTPEWALLLPVSAELGDTPRSPQLFVKPDDRWEVNDVRQHHLERAEHMEAVLRACPEALRRPGPLQLPEMRDVDDEIPPEKTLEALPEQPSTAPEEM